MITKKIVGFAICMLGILISSTAQDKQPVGNPMGESMELIFNDEFDGSSVDWSKWESRQYSQWDKNDCARGPENLEVVDGELRLNVRIENRKINERRTAKWTSGYIYSKYIVEPNTYMEARFKPGQCPGVNNAFWTACVKHQGGKISNRYEIDIVETRQDIRKEGDQGRGHLAWHDWKSFGEYTNSKGERDHIAQGYHVEHDFTGYDVWGLWYGESELIYFLNGKEVGRGDYHPRYTDQWYTGVGKFEEWNPTHEKEAYGKFGQDDWSYNGGMTGDSMSIIFANLPWGAEWTPLTDSADGTFMAVDYVRVYKPKRLLNKNPMQEVKPEGKQGTLTKKGKVKLNLESPFDLNENQNYYVSVLVKKEGQKGDFVVDFLDEKEKPIAQSVMGADGNLQVGFNKLVSTKDAFPSKDRKGEFIKDGKDYLLLFRITSKKEGKDAISLCALTVDEISEREPYYYLNIDDLGNTNITNGWHINYKADVKSVIKQISIENRGAKSLKVREVKVGRNYLSVLP